MADPTLTFLGVFVLGLATTMSACLFPVLPTFVVYIAGGTESRKRGFGAGVACTLGIVTSFLAFGLMASFIGSFMTTNYSTLNVILGVIIIIMGIIMLTPLKRVFTRLSTTHAHSVLKIQGTNGAFLTGIVFAFIAAPCAAPALLSIVLFASIGDFLWASINMGLFALGAGLPFLFVGLFAQKLDRPLTGRYTAYLVRWSSYIIGITLLVIGSWLVVEYLSV